MLKRLMLFGLIAVLLFASACSTTAPESSINKEENVPEELTEGNTGENDEPAELVFYNIARDSEEVFNARYGDLIREAFPNYTIKYIQRVDETTNLEQIIASGQRVDIIFGSLTSFQGTVIGYDMKYDMTELIEKHEVDLSRYEPTLIDAAKQMSGGKIYGLPVGRGTRAIFYNKDIFDKFGVEYPRDGMTWGVFHQLANRLNVESDGEVYVGYSPQNNYVVLQNSFSMPLVDPETQRSTFGDERWKKIIETEVLATTQNQIVQKAMQRYNKGKPLGINQFIKDKILAMYLEGHVLPIAFPEEMSQLNWDMAAMPTYEDRPGIGYQAGPNIFGITHQANNKDAAMNVIKYLGSDEFQLEFSKSGEMTSLVNEEIQQAMSSESQFKDKNFGAFYFNEPAPIRPISEIENDVSGFGFLVSKVGDLIKGNIDINTALRMAEEEHNKELDSARQ